MKAETKGAEVRAITGSPAVNVLGVIAAILMIGAVSAAPASDPSYLGTWARADGKNP